MVFACVYFWIYFCLEIYSVFNPSKSQWTCKGLSIGAISPERQQILDVVSDAKQALTAKEISKSTGTRPDNTKNLLTKMVKDGQLERVKRGYYQLPEDTEYQP